MLKKIANNPAPIYKIKVGSEDDLHKLVEIRKHTDAILRVDANAGWTFDQALEMIPVLESLKVELIEQPLAKDDYAGSTKLRAISSIPIIADESCVGLGDIEKCIDAFDGINIKLTKCSGITPAMDMIKVARSKNMKIMLGCMNESTIGTSAMVHLSPLVDYLDADGPLLLAEDIATGITYKNHHLIPSEKNGLGVDVII
jgi:L-alanine-DL-glutamate epimerase-like enolase superfamily enzyme